MPYEEGISFLKKRDKKLSWLIDRIGAVPHADPKDDFRFFVEQIIGQMLSIKVADVITERLADSCGGEITAGAICRLPADELRRSGISGRKAECIRKIALMAEDGVLDFGELKKRSDAEILEFLTSVRGIGSWTAKMYLYKIGRPDVLPYEDAVFLSAYKWLYRTRNVRPGAVRARCRKWSPYSSVAAMYLYAAFERGMPFEEESPLLKNL